MNILAANQLARAIVPLFAPGTNFIRTLFLDPIARDVYDELEARQAGAVASLRAFAGPDVDDPQLTELVGELSVKSPEFRRLWSGTTSSRSTAPSPRSPFITRRSAASSSTIRSSRSRTPAGSLRTPVRRTGEPQRAGDRDARRDDARAGYPQMKGG